MNPYDYAKTLDIVFAEKSYSDITHLMRRLESSFASVRVAENGNDIIRLCEECIPNLVICDVNLPFKTGLEVLHEIRECYGESVSVLFIDYDDSISDQTEKVSRVDGIIKHPFNFDELIRSSVSAVLGRKKFTPHDTSSREGEFGIDEGL